jgi:hypothetical protein
VQLLPVVLVAQHKVSERIRVAPGQHIPLASGALPYLGQPARRALDIRCKRTRLLCAQLNTENTRMARPGLGGAVPRCVRVYPRLSLARRRMEQLLNVALSRIAAHLCLKLQARPHRCPMRAIAAMLCGSAIARRL